MLLFYFVCKITHLIVKTYNAFEFHYTFCAEIVILRKLIAFLVQKMEDKLYRTCFFSS